MIELRFKLLILGADCTINVFTVEGLNKKGSPLFTVVEAHKKGISEISWSPDGNYLASASDDTTISIWSISEAVVDAKKEPCKKLLGHTSYVFSFSFSPAGTVGASGGFDDCLRLWDIRNERAYKEIAAHGDPITSVDFSHDGTVLVTGSYDGLIRIWDVERGHCLKTIVDNDNPPVTFACFLANSKYILAATLDSCIRLWCPSTGKCIRTFSAPGFKMQKYACGIKLITNEVTQTVILIAASEDGAIYYWNLATKELLGRHQVLSDSSPLLALDILPDKKLIACAGLEPHKEIYLISFDF